MSCTGHADEPLLNYFPDGDEADSAAIGNSSIDIGMMPNTKINAGTRRNAPCPCGSGKRYKLCCGGAAVSSMPLRQQALQAHQAGRLTRAESLYRDALAENAEDIDVLHMLGVVLFQRMRYREALETLWQAAEKTGWELPHIRHNLGLVLAKLHALAANRIQVDLQGKFVAWQGSLTRAASHDLPLVSVILPAYNHERSVAQAIASVLSQTYPNIELIVMDDSSTDGTLARIQSSLAGATIPCQVLTRENRGAPTTLNEGAALARGDYLAFLNPDDYFAPERLAKMVEEVARVGAQWGVSLVSAVRDAEQAATVMDEAFEKSFSRRQKACLGRSSNSFALLAYNLAVSTGNLFVERRLFESVGGFRDDRYSHDWDFCIRAARLAEPIVVKAPLYFYRRHDASAIKASQRDAVVDAGHMFTDLQDAPDTVACVNPLAPQWPENRVLMLTEVIRAGLGSYLPIPVLRQFAEETRQDLPTQCGDDEVKPGGPVRVRGTALVVLGMHRSGTSALTRVLNLCGAYLPDKLTPPKLGTNDKGFWETEDVIALNDRVLGSLGGAWNRVSFALPEAGPVFEEFIHDARMIVDSEYGDKHTILIKDPRIGLLAPLWHTALVASGYRPVYVVPVRNPLEVANSLHARGDMSVRNGMTLWYEYMQRIADFSGDETELMYIRFEDLFLDWRELLGRISDRLDIRLDVQGRAAEVDAFLDPALRRQSFSEHALAAYPDDPGMPKIRALYRDCVSRCETAAGARPLVKRQSGSTAREATAGFVLCIENNAIREQALLLCESIRRFGGKFRGSPILAFSPRPGLGVDRETIARLRELDVAYVDEPLNTRCPEYGSANRVFSAAWAESNIDSDFIVVLDSDTVFLDEPELPLSGDLAVRPVDTKGSASCGPGDVFEEYWRSLARLHGASLDRLPFVQSTIDGERVRASYNGGFIIARRECNLMTRWAGLFAHSVEAGLRPYRGHDVGIIASTGYVGKKASEYWGSNQAALAIVAWADAANRVVHYPASYNVPLHLLAERGAIDPTWREVPPVHVHYHWMFDPDKYEMALEFLDQLNVPREKLAWLARRVPLLSKSYSGLQ